MILLTGILTIALNTNVKEEETPRSMNSNLIKCLSNVCNNDSNRNGSDGNIKGLMKMNQPFIIKRSLMFTSAGMKCVNHDNNYNNNQATPIFKEEQSMQIFTYQI